MLVLGQAGCTYVMMVALSQPELTTLMPLLQGCHSAGLELCCTRIHLRPPSNKLLKILVEVSLFFKTGIKEEILIEKILEVCINVLIPNLDMGEGFLWLKI